MLRRRLHEQLSFQIEPKKIGRLIVQLSQFYHCSALELYNTPIQQIFDLVDVINAGAAQS